MSQDIPPQEQNRKWFRSHLLSRELELQELYDLPQGELDLVMAETAEIRSDPENRSRSHGRWCTAGYVLELAKIIDPTSNDYFQRHAVTDQSAQALERFIQSTIFPQVRI